jgi:hypothetical protein
MVITFRDEDINIRERQVFSAAGYIERLSVPVDRPSPGQMRGCKVQQGSSNEMRASHSINADMRLIIF